MYFMAQETQDHLESGKGLNLHLKDSINGVGTITVFVRQYRDKIKIKGEDLEVYDVRQYGTGDNGLLLLNGGHGYLQFEQVKIGDKDLKGFSSEIIYSPK